MKGAPAYIILFLMGIGPALASYPASNLDHNADMPYETQPIAAFLARISDVSERFIGMPFKYGGRPSITGTTDNSSLFYAIYTSAVQNTGLTYTKPYLPMRYLLENMVPVAAEKVRNGDLIVLKNNLAALVYRVEFSGRMHFIYASKKRQQVISFHSENLVYHAYWLAHLKGFYRLNKDILQPSR